MAYIFTREKDFRMAKRAVCQHCRKPCNRSSIRRGLCRSCRRVCPLCRKNKLHISFRRGRCDRCRRKVAAEQAEFLYRTGGAMPSEPLRARPGSDDKIFGMRQRAEQKLAIFHPNDGLPDEPAGWRPPAGRRSLPRVPLPDRPTIQDVRAAMIEHSRRFDEPDDDGD